MKNDKTIQDTDRRIASILRSEAPVPPSKDWFTRKTLNRLPDKQPCTVSLSEVVAFFIVLAVSVTVVIRQTKEMLSSGDLTASNTAILLSGLAMAICATLYISVPLLKKY